MVAAALPHSLARDGALINGANRPTPTGIIAYCRPNDRRLSRQRLKPAIW
jgi:hypothetical protein